MGRCANRFKGPMRASLALLVTLAIPALAVAADNSQVYASPSQLMRSVAQKEAAAADGDSIKHVFRSRKITPQGSQTKLYVETRDAIAGMVIGYNDHPASPDQLKAEESRLQNLINNPRELGRKQKQEKEDEERTLRIVKALPEAFIFEYDGAEIGTAEVGKPGAKLIRLNFHPNPDYKPPTHVEQILTGMQGYVLVDAQCNRLARIDGELFKDVGFGWDIMGHLNKGGHFLVQQAETEDGTWEVSHMALNFTGKILMVKTINITSEEVFSNFRRVPDTTTFAQGVALLKNETMASEQQAQNRQIETSQRYAARR